MESVYSAVDLVYVVCREIFVYFLIKFRVTKLAFGFFYVAVYILYNDCSPFVCFGYNYVVAIFQ